MAVSTPRDHTGYALGVVRFPWSEVGIGWILRSGRLGGPDATLPASGRGVSDGVFGCWL